MTDGRRKDDRDSSSPFDAMKVIAFVFLIITSSLGMMSLLKDLFLRQEEIIDEHIIKSEKRLTRLEVLVDQLLLRRNKKDE